MGPRSGGATKRLFAIPLLGGGRLGLGNALPHLRRHVHRGERAHDVLFEPELALELLHHAGAAGPHDHRVDAVAPPADLIRETPLAPLLHLRHLGAQLLEPAGHTVGEFLSLHLVVAGLEDVDRLVLGHVSDSSWRSPAGPILVGASSGSSLRLNRFMAPRAPSATQLSTASAARRIASSSAGISSGANVSSTCSRSSAELSAAPTPIRSRA